MSDGDLIALIIGGSLLAIGLLSMLVGQIARLWDWLRGPVTVKRSQVVMSPAPAQTVQTAQTKNQTDEVSKHNLLWREFLLDKTRASLIAVMADSDLTVGEIRGLLKGDNGAIGTEVEAARKRLGLPPTSSYRTPIAGRPTDPKYYPGEPELEFEPPR